MPGYDPVEEAPGSRFTSRGRRLAGSRLINWVIQLPPVAWGARTLARIIVKRHIGKNSGAATPAERTAEIGLEATLDQVVHDVVEALGYAGAMVTTREPGDSLPVRALHVDPRLATEEQIHRWENEISDLTGQPASITDPRIARVYVYRDECQENLSVRAFRVGGPVSSNDLYDLFTPVVPPAARPIVKGIQQALGIQQVIAIPFFLETHSNGQRKREIVGNLFAAKRGPISKQDELTLSAFGRQVATAIESERRRIQIEMSQRLVLEMQSSIQDEEQILYQIAHGLMSELGYVGTLVATFEPDGSLPVRVFCFDSNLLSDEQIADWERDISSYAGRPVSISDPKIARVYVHREEARENISVRAFETGQPVSSSSLYALFSPVAPPASRSIVQGIQEALGIRQIVAVPFFRETKSGDEIEREFVGNLVAATRSREFSSGEIELLRAFGQQAAVCIQNARLHHQAKERRRAAQIFGQMAFSATASVHELRNHMGALRIYLHLLGIVPPEQLEEILESNPKVVARLDEAVEILDNLHQPWHDMPNAQTNVNACLTKSIDKVIPERDGTMTREGIVVHLSLTEGLPMVRTSAHKLAEAFKVLIENALDAIREQGQGGELRIASRLGGDNHIQVSVSDNGSGIRPENLDQVFEMQWSTKEKGMGFGLFWAKEYVEGLDGTIRVESDSQEGTTFTVTLPSIVAAEELIAGED